MKLGAVVFLSVVIFSCTTTEASEKLSQNANPKEISQGSLLTVVEKKLSMDSDFQPIQLEEAEIPPTPDSSFVYQVVFQIETNLFLAVAQPTKLDREGVRLQLIEKKGDNKFKLLGSSSPAYDSPMLFPNFFKNDLGQIIIMANMGEEESWGAKVYYIGGKKIKDIGFVDIANVERRQFPKEDGSMESYRPIVPSTKITSNNSGLTFSFEGKKMVLYDDLNGNLEVIFSKGEYEYLYDGKDFKLVKK